MTIENSFLKKLQDELNPRRVGYRKLNRKAEAILQNIQDMRNNDNAPGSIDKLKKTTTCFETKNGNEQKMRSMTMTTMKSQKVC